MAGRIPETFIDELLTRVDIIDVIDTRVPLKKAGKDYKACCPFHEEKTPSFTVSQDKQFYHCFGCGAHGSAIGFLMDYEHMSFPEAIRDLAAGVGLEVPQQAGDYDPAAQQRSDKLIEILRQAEHYYRRQLREHPQAQGAVDYLKGRGLTGEIAASFALGFAPPGWDSLLQALGQDEETRKLMVQAGLLVEKEQGGYYDRFRQRIMFPIEDYRGRIVGFGGRVVGKEEPKYLNSPETPVFHKGREIYGLYRGRDAIRRQQQVLVVEGYMDVVALAQFGIDYVVATLGTATTKDHLERLFRFAPEVVFSFDGDRAGRDAAWRALEQSLAVLHDGRQVSFLFLPEGEDPDSFIRQQGRSGFEQQLRQAVSLPEYLFEALSQQVSLTRIDGRARLVELARPLLQRIPEGILRQMLLQRLGELSQMAPETLSELLITPKTPIYKGVDAGEAAGKSTGAAGSGASGSGRGPPVSSLAPGARLRGGGLQRPPSLVRQALALLLQHPHLAEQAMGPRLQELELPGMPLLRQLYELLQVQSGPRSAGAIVERFRDSEHYPILQKLVLWEYPRRQPDVESEFKDALKGLERAWISQAMERLLAKQRAVGLNTEEKQEMQRLIEEKHGQNRVEH